MLNFWQQLNRPIYALAPLAGITDSAFRQVCKKSGADLVYSEMVSATALYYGSEESIELMRFDECERPNVVQLFGSVPEHFAVAVKIISEKINLDGIDINFGCPVPKVIKQGAGAALFADLEKSRAVIEAVLQNTHLPVSIKTRTEAYGVKLEQFLENIQDLPLAAIMIHGRSLKQGFSGEVDAEAIKKARQNFNGIIIANGGVKNVEDAEKLLAESGADGIGIGQGALGRPWFFEEIKKYRSNLYETVNRNGFNYLTEEEKKKIIYQTATEHASLVFKLKGEQGIIEMRKHLCWYVSGLSNASELRKKLVKISSLEGIRDIFC